MKATIFVSAALYLIALAGTANGQPVGLGTTKGGGFAQISNGVAKVVTTKTDVKMRPQPMGGTQQYLPMINAGELEFGISNIIQAVMARTGTGYSEGHVHPNISLAATLTPTVLGPAVAADSKIKSVADFKGVRFPHGFKSAPQIQNIFNAFLANAGISWDEVDKVPSVGLSQHFDQFKQGALDVAGAPVGSGAVKELNASVTGGVRFVSLDDSAAAVARVRELLPGARIEVMQPSAALTGIVGPTKVLSYDTMLIVNTKVADETVYKVVKSIYENEKELQETSALWRGFDRKVMARAHGDFPYHPGAVKYFKEAGLLN